MTYLISSASILFSLFIANSKVLSIMVSRKEFPISINNYNKINFI